MLSTSPVCACDDCKAVFQEVLWRVTHVPQQLTYNQEVIQTGANHTLGHNLLLLLLCVCTGSCNSSSCAAALCCCPSLLVLLLCQLLLDLSMVLEQGATALCIFVQVAHLREVQQAPRVLLLLLPLPRQDAAPDGDWERLLT